MNDRESLELKPLLIRLLTRGCWILFVVTMVLILVSMEFRSYLQQKIAYQLTQAVRSDLLMGDSAAALKILQPNVDDHFWRITYWEQGTPVFVLAAEPDEKRPLGHAITRLPLCLDEGQAPCAAELTFEFSLLAFVPLVLLGAGLMMSLLLLIFWIFRQHVSAYYRVQLKHHQEAALGRWSARICHDLKIPSMIFQRAAYASGAADFFEMQPLLQSHLQRLHRMIEKLERADVEGLVHIESHRLTRSNFQGFLASLVTDGRKLEVMMPEILHVRLDLEKFERTLANLVLNAFQAGAGSVRVQLEPIQGDLRVRVANDGSPMAPERIQDFLHRHMNPASPGLGLEIVKDMVAAHGGRHDLTSTSETTCFTLLFPHALIQEQEPLPSEPDMENKRLLPLGAMIYVDRELMDTVLHHISQDERGVFHFTDDPGFLTQARLVVSRQEQSIEFGLQHGIPILVAGPCADDRAWIHSLKSRLRLLNRAQSLPVS